MPHRWTILASVAFACRVANAQPTQAPDKLDTTPAAAQPGAPAEAPSQPPPESLEHRDPSWQIDIEPAVWFVGASGRVRLPRSTPTGAPNTKTDIASLNLDNPRFVPFGEVEVRKGDWRFTLRGFYYDAEKDASGNAGTIGDLTFATGDTLRTSLTFASYEIEGAYTLAGNRLNQSENGIYAVAARFDVIAGLRIYDVDWTVTNLGSGSGTARTSADDVSFQPLVGLKLNVDLWRDVTIHMQATLGGDPTSMSDRYSGDIIAGLMYRPTPHVGVQIGYRSLFFGVAKGNGEGELSFNGAMQGLYGGLELRF
jgi:hypothetical protein